MDNHRKGGADPLLVFSLLFVAAAFLIVPPATAELASSPETYVAITCGLPGQVVEAGETARFELDVTNRGMENNKKVWSESPDTERYDWDIRFVDGETRASRLWIPTNGSKKITLIVETGSETPAGEYTVRAHIGDGWFWAYVTVSETHAGEKGTLQLSIVDKDGEKIKGAKVAFVRESDRVTSDQVMSSADGKVSADVVPGRYTLKIGRDGYREIERKDVHIKGGITTDEGTVMLEKVPYAAEITVKSAVITTTADRNPKYELTIRNIGSGDDTFRFGTEGLPEGWYVRFQEAGSSGSDISEMFIKSGEEKALAVEAIPSYGAPVGDYPIALTIDTSAAEYRENLTAKIKGSYDLRVYADQYQYSVNKGSALDIALTLTNAGNAGTLTNVNVTVSAPEGWTADITPETIAGIPEGGQAKVNLKIVPPGNIVASEYKVSVKVASDQTEKSDDFRVQVKEQSLVAAFGILLLVLIGGGVYYMFRKYNRR